MIRIIKVKFLVHRFWNNLYPYVTSNVAWNVACNDACNVACNAACNDASNDAFNDACHVACNVAFSCKCIIVFHKESSKIVLKLFLKKPSTNYETPSSYESTDTKIFKKIERELGFWAVQSIWVQ